MHTAMIPMVIHNLYTCIQTLLYFLFIRIIIILCDYANNLFLLAFHQLMLNKSLKCQ